MSYTSGRTVTTTRTVKPSTPAAATRTARKLVTKHLPNLPGVTINSRPDYDLTADRSQVRTLITYCTGTDYRALAAAAESLPGVVSVTPATSSIVIVFVA